ncbi:MAG: hypothetical protein AB1545_16450 [Thermodesulfobacteriota bacterium]
MEKRLPVHFPVARQGDAAATRMPALRPKVWAEGYGVRPPTREAGAVISPADIEFCHKICDNRLIAPGRKGKHP